MTDDVEERGFGLHRPARRLDLSGSAPLTASRIGVSHSRRGVSHLCQPLLAGSRCENDSSSLVCLGGDGG